MSNQSSDVLGPVRETIKSNGVAKDIEVEVMPTSTKDGPAFSLTEKITLGED